MYNFVMIFEDTNVPPNRITVQIKSDDMENAVSKGLDVLGEDSKGNSHVWVRTIGVQEIPEIPEEEPEEEPAP